MRRQDVPWRVVRGFPNAAGETLAHLHNISGGILDRDELDLRIDVGRGACAQVTSTGATRIYRSRAAEHCARAHVEVNVAEDGFLEFVPDALIPYAGARYEQSTHVHLRDGASLIWWEMVSPGREAAGEIFRYERIASRFEITTGRGQMISERWELLPGSRPLDSIARLGQYRHFASLYLCRAGAGSMEAELMRMAGEQSCAGEISWGASSLGADGAVLRGVAKNGRLLAASLTALWQAAKPAMCGRVATIPRKIH